jgi:hypothetical protein
MSISLYFLWNIVKYISYFENVSKELLGSSSIMCSGVALTSSRYERMQTFCR